MSDQIKSASVVIKPQDSRCRYWAKIIRAAQTLPTPSTVNGANDIAGAYLRKGGEELFPGDFMIEGEEMHHRKARGWTYHVTYCDQNGALHRVANPGSAEKAVMKAAGMPATLLAGSGEVAAAVRYAHGVRLALIA